MNCKSVVGWVSPEGGGGGGRGEGGIDRHLSIEGLIVGR